MRVKAQRHDGKWIPVHWQIVPVPPPPPMRKLWNGEQIRSDVPHQPWAETDGVDIILVYCYGCQRYFTSYHKYMWRHGLCKEKPKGEK